MPIGPSPRMSRGTPAWRRHQFDQECRERMFDSSGDSLQGRLRLTDANCCGLWVPGTSLPTPRVPFPQRPRSASDHLRAVRSSNSTRLGSRSVANQLKTGDERPLCLPRNHELNSSALRQMMSRFQFGPNRWQGKGALSNCCELAKVASGITRGAGRANRQMPTAVHRRHGVPEFGTRRMARPTGSKGRSAREARPGWRGP